MIIRLVDNEFLAILVMGDSTLLLKHVLLGFINKDILIDIWSLQFYTVPSDYHDTRSMGNIYIS